MYFQNNSWTILTLTVSSWMRDLQVTGKNSFFSWKMKLTLLHHALFRTFCHPFLVPLGHFRLMTTRFSAVILSNYWSRAPMPGWGCQGCHGTLTLSQLGGGGADYAPTSLLVPPDFQTFLQPCNICPPSLFIGYYAGLEWAWVPKVRKLFKGGNYSRPETIWGNTV